MYVTILHIYKILIYKCFNYREKRKKGKKKKEIQKQRKVVSIDVRVSWGQATTPDHGMSPWQGPGASCSFQTPLSGFFLSCQVWSIQVTGDPVPRKSPLLSLCKGPGGCGALGRCHICGHKEKLILLLAGRGDPSEFREPSSWGGTPLSPWVWAEGYWALGGGRGACQSPFTAHVCLSYLLLHNELPQNLEA